MQRFLRLALVVSSAIVAMLALPTVGRAQGVTTGGIAGTVLDSSGTALAGVTVRITNQGGGIGKVEWVEVTFSAGHTFWGDLEVDLTSPAGTVSRLTNVHRRIVGPRVQSGGDTPGHPQEERDGPQHTWGGGDQEDKSFPAGHRRGGVFGP